MKICLITPAPKQSCLGNRVTANRWARMLRRLGHDIAVGIDYHGERYDLMIALHAYRSHSAIARFRKTYPSKPLIVVLTGTDVYGDIHSKREAVASLELADRLVVLQPLAIEELPKGLRAKARAIYQSAEGCSRVKQGSSETFDVCSLSHLRQVKDPFRTAIAVRDLPVSSRIRVLHVGAALSEEMEKRAVAEMRENARYRWLGEQSVNDARSLMARSRLLVLSSLSEGGANVISEAVVCSVPILASEIPGSVGLLGAAYPGYFPAGDTEKLRALLLKAENEPAFVGRLRNHIEELKPLFHPKHELSAWKDLLAEFV